MPQDNAICNGDSGVYVICNGDSGVYVHLLHPVQVLKNHLQLKHGSLILDHIRTRFLGGTYTWSDLYMRVIKKFSAWPSSVQNKIKIVFASYSSSSQNTTCTIWLLGYKYSVHFSVCFLHSTWKKWVTQCNEMTILTELFGRPSNTVTVLLQCFDTVVLVIRPVKIRRCRVGR